MKQNQRIERCDRRLRREKVDWIWETNGTTQTATWPIYCLILWIDTRCWCCLVVSLGIRIKSHMKPPRESPYNHFWLDVPLRLKTISWNPTKLIQLWAFRVSFNLSWTQLLAYKTIVNTRMESCRSLNGRFNLKLSPTNLRFFTRSMEIRNRLMTHLSIVKLVCQQHFRFES